jgi:glutamate synthase (NADPH/NADH) small chain
MDCGVPFCHTGCPVNNLIPDWNDLVYNNRWEAAIRRLHATNNFLSSPAASAPLPCEAACVLGINQPPSPSSSSSAPSSSAPGTRAGFIPSRPSRPPASASPLSAAVPRAWPPRSNCAAPATPSPCMKKRPHRRTAALRHSQLQARKARPRSPHRADARRRRRLPPTRTSASMFPSNRSPNTTTPSCLRRRRAAARSAHPRPRAQGHSLRHGVSAPAESPQRRRLGRDASREHESRAPILATGKRVVIIGGGDTGADCLGTSHRQGAKSVTSSKSCPSRPERAASTPWPLWPLQLRTESSHEEGGIRDWSINSVKFTGDENGNVKQLHLAIRVGPPPKFEPIAGLRVHARRRSGPARHGLPRPRRSTA